MKSLWHQLMSAWWESQARHLAGRLIELENEAKHVQAAKREVADRLRKASARCVQYGELA